MSDARLITLHKRMIASKFDVETLSAYNDRAALIGANAVLKDCSRTLAQLVLQLGGEVVIKPGIQVSDDLTIYVHDTDEGRRLVVKGRTPRMNEIRGEELRGVVLLCPEETCFRQFIMPLALEPDEILERGREYHVLCPYCETHAIVEFNDTWMPKPGEIVHDTQFRVYKDGAWQETQSV